VVTDEHGLTASSKWSSFALAGATVVLLPTAPTPLTPANNQTIKSSVAPVALTVANGSDPEGQPLSYWFELDTSSSFDGPNKVKSGAIAQMPEQTYWETPPLSNNTTYYWRTRVDNGSVQSPWVGARFEVNVGAQNLAPPMPTLNGPLDGVSVSTATPFFELNPVQDPEGDAVTYEFELYADSALTALEGERSASVAHWQLESPLVAGAPYFWRYRSVDENNNTAGWAGPFSFVLVSAGPNQAPQFEFIKPKKKTHVLSGSKVIIQWQDSDPDSSATINLFYRKSGHDRVKIAGDIAEDDDGEADRYIWKTVGLYPGTYTLEADIIDENGTVNTGAWGHINITPWTCKQNPTVQEQAQGFSHKPCFK
jgi:hypothetical protein